MPEVSSVNFADSSTLPLRTFTSASAGFPAERNMRPGLVQNWPAPRVKEPYSYAAIFSPRAAGGDGTGEADCFHERMLHEGGADGNSGIEEQRKNAFGQIASAHAIANDAAHQFTGTGMSGVGFDDDRISGGEGRGGIATRDGEGEWKIAGTENDDGAQRAQHRADIWLRNWFSLRIGVINARRDPGTFADYFCKHADLRAGPAGFGLQTSERERGFLMGARDQRFGLCFDAGGDRFQELRSCFARHPREKGAGCGVEFDGEVNFFTR